ncbi:MAG TPA: DUF1810 domain-containing protein [Dehalococcoidia bacterium]|nr:DUF1810 domain-containing protein [Dehalococcoidia bacterium]
MSSGIDSFNLQRFVDAQATVYEHVRDELQAGAKRSHWMWFIFPQLKQLGQSSTSKFYGLGSLQEAQAYWRHPLLGLRLKECTALVLAVEGKTAFQIFSTPDDLKFQSCMTLFERAAPKEPSFGRALAKYYRGGRDRKTLALLAEEN